MSDKWDEVEDPDEDEEVKQTLKEQFAPKDRFNMPIPDRFLATTKGLFYEHRHHTTVKQPCPFTLGNMDRMGNSGHIYKSMYMIYMSCDSEYEAAIALLGSYPHWCKLKKCSWFQEYLIRWENERTIRDEAIARSILIRLAECGNVTAARTVYANAEKTKGKIGRPSKGGKREETDGLSELEIMLQRSAEADGD